MSESRCLGCPYQNASSGCSMNVRDRNRDYFSWDIVHQGGGNSVAPYVPAPCGVIHQMLSLVKLQPGEVLYDLGSGDGCILILAAGKFNAKAVGYEVDEKLAKKASEMVRAFHLQDCVEVIHDDLFNADVGKADVVILYLSNIGNQLVKPKLENELKPGARILSLEFEVPGWGPHRVIKIVDGNLTYTIYLYKK